MFILKSFWKSLQSKETKRRRNKPMPAARLTVLPRPTGIRVSMADGWWLDDDDVTLWKDSRLNWTEPPPPYSKTNILPSDLLQPIPQDSVYSDLSRHTV